MIRAAITPGTQPQSVKINTMSMEPQPLSITAKGGNKIDRSTRQNPIRTKLRIIPIWVAEIEACYVSNYGSVSTLLQFVQGRILLFRNSCILVSSFMRKHYCSLWILLVLTPLTTWSQYSFSGVVDAENLEGKVYLSVIEDYRKISGVYPEQILNVTQPDSLGHFSFNGNNLSEENKMYRIHIDKCSLDEADSNHFTGHCLNSEEIVFIANNNTTLSLPFSFGNEMFCKVVAENDYSKSFLKIDSLKADMRFAFSTYRSEANRKLNSEKWFGTLQTFGEQLDEPLAELYSYAFLSDRSSNLHAYYLADLKENAYYDQLLERLQKQYPNSSYTEQYAAELRADKVLISSTASSTIPWWVYLLAVVSVLSLVGNYIFFGRLNRIKQQSVSTEQLSAQEQKVLDYILQDKTNKEIATELFVSVSTVKTHINNLYKKLQVSSRDEVKRLNT